MPPCIAKLLGPFKRESNGFANSARSPNWGFTHPRRQQGGTAFSDESRDQRTQNVLEYDARSLPCRMEPCTCQSRPRHLFDQQLGLLALHLADSRLMLSAARARWLEAESSESLNRASENQSS